MHNTASSIPLFGLPLSPGSPDGHKLRRFHDFMAVMPHLAPVANPDAADLLGAAWVRQEAHHTAHKALAARGVEATPPLTRLQYAWLCVP